VLRDRAADGLLSGIRVLDFTAYWAGPYATKWLADFGAEVIKVEPANRLDLIRSGASIDFTYPQSWNVSAYFNNYSRGKQSAGIDPTHPEGRRLLLELVPKCDVVIENFKAGRMAALGFSYEELRAARSDLIMVSISGYGQDGSDAGLAGVGTNMEQLSGIASLNGYQDSPQAYNSGIAYGDPVSGTLAAATIAMALLHRDATGEGQFIDIAGHETLVSMIGEQFAALSLGVGPRAKGNRHPDMAPHGCYPCTGDDRWLTIAVRDDAQWRSLCAAIDRPDLADAYPTLSERHAAEHEIDASIIGWTVLQEDYTAARTLQNLGIAAAPVLAPRDQMADPHLRLRGYFQTVADPDMGPWPHDGIAWRLSRTPGVIRGPAPRLGEHSRDVLRRLLGRTPEAIEELYRCGAISDPPGRA
jgi:crotonobetainyl-CoA:carnitine CoA-transferase CaiB-like acyl-CoA transferase